MLDKIPFIRKQLDSHMQEVVQGASEAFALKILATGLGFAFHIVLARLLGAERAGIYFLALTVTTIAAVLGRVGLDNTLVRFTSANAAVGDWRAVKGLYKKGIKRAVIASSLLAVLMAMTAPWLAEIVFNKTELTSLLRWMALAVVPSAILTLYADLLKGLKRIRDAILVLSVLMAVFSLLGVVVLVPLRSVQGAVWAFTLATILTLLIAFWRWHTATPQLRGIKGHFDTSQLLQSSIPLFWMSVMQLVIARSSTLVLGIWYSSADVGIFGVANRTAMFTRFILVAVNSIAAPKFAALYRQGEMEVLGRIARNMAKLMALIASPILLLFMFAPGWVMGIFGPQFSEGATVLSILAVGQFVNVVTGSVGVLLIMCGHERMMRNNLVLCAIINLVLNVMLVPYIGAMGAAIATATTLSLQNLIGAGLVWWKLRIVTIPIFRKEAKVKA